MKLWINDNGNLDHKRVLLEVIGERIPVEEAADGLQISLVMDGNVGPEESYRIDECGGAFTVIRADKLDYAAIIQALRSGHFYASTGPEIRALWLEDGRIHIECSDADRILLNTGIRRPEKIASSSPFTVKKVSSVP